MQTAGLIQKQIAEWLAVMPFMTGTCPVECVQCVKIRRIVGEGEFTGTARLDFQDDWQDQRAFAGVFVDVAFQVDADFFLQDAPVDFFFGVGILNVFRTTSRAPAISSIAVIVQQESAGNDFGLRAMRPVCLSMAMMGTTTPSSERWRRSRITDSSISSSEPESTQTAAGGNRVAAEGAVFGEFDVMAVFHQQNFAGDDAELMCERGVAEQVAIFAVDRDEIFRLARAAG